MCVCLRLCVYVNALSIRLANCHSHLPSLPLSPSSCAKPSICGCSNTAFVSSFGSTLETPVLSLSLSLSLFLSNGAICPLSTYQASEVNVRIIIECVAIGGDCDGSGGHHHHHQQATNKQNKQIRSSINTHQLTPADKHQPHLPVSISIEQKKGGRRRNSPAVAAFNWPRLPCLTLFHSVVFAVRSIPVNSGLYKFDSFWIASLQVAFWC